MDSVRVTEHEGVLSVTLHRPDKHNAFEPSMIINLTNAFKAAAASTTLRAVVMKGEGPSFCAGADLDWMKSMKDFSQEQNRQDSLQLFAMYEAIYHCPLPVLTSVHGNVFGGGVGLVAASDIAVGTNDTRFCLSEVRLGLVPAVISPFLLRRLPVHKASEWMLTGRPFFGTEAMQAGLLNFAGSAEEAEGYLQKAVAGLKACGPKAVRDTKHLLRFVRENEWPEIKEETTRVIAERRVSQEGQEGLAAFFEKRPPEWKNR